MKSSQVQKILVSHKLEFSKYQASGNDFIIIDDRENPPLEMSFQLIRRLCHRKFGVGADGVILLQLSTQADFKMVIFNADGFEATMCGNGLRSFIAYLKDYDLIQDTTKIETKSGIHHCQSKEGLITITFSDPKNLSLNHEIDGKLFHFIHTGVDHAIHFTDQIDDPNFLEIARKVRHCKDLSKDGVNVSFAKLHENQIKIRTYEKGCEEETLACGTAAIAACLLATTIYGVKPPFEVTFPSDDKVCCNFQIDDKEFKKTTLTGSAKGVFNGIFKLN